MLDRGTEMKAYEIMIAWTAVAENMPTAGKVEVGILATKGDDITVGLWPGKYLSSIKGAEVADPAGLLETFHRIVVRDRIDPQMTHQEFLKIDEYAEWYRSNIV